MIPRPIYIIFLLGILCSMLNAQYWEGDLLLGPSSYEYYSSIEDELIDDTSGGPSGPGGPGGPGGPSAPSFDPITSTITDLSLPEDWETSGSAEINPSWLGSVGAEFKTFDTSPDTYFTIADIDALPLTFNEGGRVYIERLDIYYYHTLNGYIKFSSSDSDTEIIEPFSLISSDSTLIEIPPIPNVDFDHFSLHFDADSANLTSTLTGLTIESDYKPGPVSIFTRYREGLKILDCNPDAEGSIIIPSNVTEIGPRAFVNCNNITSISIGNRDEVVKDEVFLIHGGAFSDAEKLNAIFVDKEVKVEIAEPYLAQFNNNRASNSLLDESLSSWDIIINDTSFYTGLSPRLILGAGSDTSYDDFDSSINNNYQYVRKSIHHLDSWISENIILKDEISFETDTYSFGLNSRNNYTLIGAIDTLPNIIDIPSSVNGYNVDEIGPAAFYDNHTITEVNIPSTVKIIGDNAFSGCSSLLEIKLNEGLEIISGLSFTGCISLESILIPESVTKIEEFAFSGCDSLSKVTILGNNFFATDSYYSVYAGPFEDQSPPITRPIVYVESKSSGWQYPQTRIGYSFIDIKFNPSIALSDSYQIKLGDSLTLSALSYDLFKDYDGDGNLDVDEDINENGNLDPGEDIDADGKLDQSEPLTETVNGYQWYYGVFPIAQSLGGNDENFTILGEEQYEGFWKLELLQDGAVISSQEFYVSVYNDTDSDGLHDAVETGTGVYLSADDTGTDPNNADSDGDTLTDGDEILIHQTDPNNADSDGDTLTDGDEILIHQTDPNNTDSDGDTILDHTEIMNGTNPNLADTDSDGLDDSQEITYGTDPNLADTSGDGLSDGIIVNAGFNPTVDYSNLLNQRPTQALYDEVVAERDAKLSIEQVKDLRPGSTMIEVSGNQATVQLQMEESSDLQTWEDTGTPATMTIPADTDTKFFRFKMAE